MRIAIVGFGPRGLAAAEFALGRHPDARIDVFEPCPWPAAGPNFAPGESPLCLLNLPLRSVDLPPPPGGGPDFADWLVARDGAEADPDHYAPRRDLGAYLTDRLAGLETAFPGRLVLHPATATAARRDGDRWWLTADAVEKGPFDAMLLTLGQPDTEPDEQLRAWADFAARRGFDLVSAYPGDELQRRAADWAGRVVAIRGLGLSTLDVLALLTLGQGGRVEDGAYVPSGREPALILPFSLNGLPPWPKPVMEIDARFRLTVTESDRLTLALDSVATDGPDAALQAIAAAIAVPAQRITGQPADDWLAAEIAEAGSQLAEADPVEVLREGIDMARGAVPPSVGYAVGQIWRHAQDALRGAFRDNRGNAETRTAIIGFDGGLKRMTYGPPVASAELLLALIDCGLVRLTLAEDPGIEMGKGGWIFEHAVAATVMIDAVLPGATLEAACDPLLAGLEAQGVIERHRATGGVRIDAQGRAGPGLGVLGRLTEGSTVATDSIHDCFGPLTRAWAADPGDHA